MKINITVEVESTEALATILDVGSNHSLYDYNITAYQILDNLDNGKMKFKNRKKGKMKYILITYKERQRDSGTGYCEKTYHSGLDIIVCENEEELIKKASEIKSNNSFLGYNECEYELTVIRGDLLIEEGCVRDKNNMELFDSINNQAAIIVENKKKRIREDHIKKEKEDNAKRKRAKAKRDKITYERLKKRFGK